MPRPSERLAHVYCALLITGDSEVAETAYCTRLYSMSLRGARANARELLSRSTPGEQQIDGEQTPTPFFRGYVTIQRLRIALSGRGWLLRILNKRHWIIARVDVERWESDDGLRVHRVAL